MSEDFRYSGFFKLFIILFAIYMFLGVVFQVFLFKNANYCPFKYGVCGNVKSEYLFPWMFNRLWWPVEFVFFLLFTVGGGAPIF